MSYRTKVGEIEPTATSNFAPLVMSGKGSGQDLLALQRLAWTSITFSVTRRCPLRCGHCITRSAPDLTDPVLGLDTARIWATDILKLAKLGLQHISFTGGEPLMALDAVVLLSQAAHSVGISSYIVTSGAWASTPEVARRVVGRLQHIVHWDIGYDVFHADHLPRARLENVISALSQIDACYTLRVCMSDDDRETKEFLRSIYGLVGDNGVIVLQSTRALGRAESDSEKIRQDQRQPHLPMRPCVSTGLFVRADGTTGPCCSGLAYEQAANHPFQYNKVVRAGDLVAAWHAWRNDPLLRLLRLVGFAALDGWLREAGLLNNIKFSSDPCEACVSLWRDVPTAGEGLKKLAGRPEVIEKLDAVEEALYSKVWCESEV